ncbi:MAG: hypothetical protein ACNI3H_00600 [Halarcobacter ebronensis]|uniref:hypothetical protein n=1 Tax=Halarcobacter ebronensis TaxID=1462615 RepID=UPI003C74FB14
MLIDFDKKNNCFNFYNNDKEELKFSIKKDDIDEYFEKLMKKVHSDFDLLNQIYIAIQEESKK